MAARAEVAEAVAVEMIKPVLVKPTRFAATLEMNVSRTTTSCLTN